jgi:uncharacterized protein (TIGR01777 family)
VVHLAGAPVLQRWTPKNRDVIYRSRIETTTCLVNALGRLSPAERPSLFLAVSAIGIYRTGRVHTESSQDFDTHFAARLTIDWEKASAGLSPDIRRVIFRTGLVLDSESQLISLLWFPFIAGLGGAVGKGSQAFPFIHLSDLTAAMVEAIDKESYSGVYNLVAPDRKDNRSFAKELANKLKRPSMLSVPGVIVKLLFGKASVLVLESPEIIPERLVRDGYIFQYPDLESALSEIISTKKGRRFRQPSYQKMIPN